MASFKTFNHVDENYEEKLKNKLEEEILILLVGPESEYIDVKLPPVDTGNGSINVVPTYQQLKEDFRPKANRLANYMHSYVYEMIDASIKGHLSSYHNYNAGQSLTSDALGVTINPHYVGEIE